MKIAQVVCVYPPYAGGIGTAAFDFQNIFSKDNNSFVFVTNNKHKYEDPKIIATKALLKLGHGAILLQLLWKLKKFDLIYFHYPFFGSAIIIWLFKIFNPEKRLIIHYHMDVNHKNILFKILSWPEEIIKKSLFKKSEKIIIASLDYIKNSNIKNIYKKYPEKFQEIPFSINTEEFRPSPEKKQKNNILFVGGLDKAHYFKGVELLLSAFSKIKELEANLIIAGDGDLKDYYKNIAKKLNIQDKVSFLGKLNKNELIKNYQEAKVLVLPSINSNEAFGIVSIEAMACGAPVISSDLPGVRSVYEDGKSGLSFKLKDVKDLQDKIEYILKNKDIQAKMSQEARDLCLKKYSKNVVESEILKLL